MRGVGLIASRYELVREIGSTAEVLRWEAFDSALERRVLLEFPRQDIGADSASRERFWQGARASARGSTVTGQRVLDAGTDPETGRVFVVREWPEHAAERTVALPVVERQGLSRTPRLALVGALLGVGLAVVMLRPGVEGWLAWVNAPLGSISNQFVLGPVPKPPTVGAAATVASPTTPADPTRPPTPPAKATPTVSAGAQRRIINTDGRGVALRAAAGGDRLPGKGYDEGATVTAFESSGEWTRIRGSDGREGWVLSVTLSR